MANVQYLLAVTLVSAGVTWSLRAFPFPLLAPLRGSKLLPYLAENIPVGLMIILAVYTLRDVNLVEPSSMIPMTVGVGATGALHLWKSNMLLSIAGGTSSYVLLMSTGVLAIW